jgi:integrase
MKFELTIGPIHLGPFYLGLTPPGVAAATPYPPDTIQKDSIPPAPPAPPISDKKVAEIVKEFLTDQKVAGEIGKRRLDSLRLQLGVFAKKLDCPLSRVGAPEINAVLHDVGPSSHTRRHYRDAFSTLVNWSRSHGQLPAGWSHLDMVRVPRVKPVEIIILTPQQGRDLLARADRRLIPFLALSMFAGIRHGEMSGKNKILDWRDINLAERSIFIRPTVAKIGRARHIPIGDALYAWLKPFERPSGPVLRLKHARNLLTAAKRAAGIPMNRLQTRNSLRHSYVSYRLAIVKNEAQVAIEAGNTVYVIRANYLQIVKEADAVEWFKIMPPDDTDGGIIQLSLFR